MQIGLQANATSLDTGSYPYTMTVADDPRAARRRPSPTPATPRSKTPPRTRPSRRWAPAGRSAGLEKIIPATGGVILDEGSGAVAWFSGSFGSGGGTYTSPAGDFSDAGAQQQRHLHADPDRRHAARTSTPAAWRPPSVDRNGLTTTFGYSGNLLAHDHRPVQPGSRRSPTTAAMLQSIEDPASRSDDLHDVGRRPDRRRISRRPAPGIMATTAPAR